MHLKRIDAIVLAAGASARFGSDKRLHMVAGVPMLQRAITAVIDSVQVVHVVLRDDDAVHLPVLLGSFFGDARVQPLLLEQPQQGMGSNLARAVAALPVDSAAALVMLADLPYLQQQTVRQIVAAGQSSGIVVPACASGEVMWRGHPVLFARDFFPLLQQLSGDSGARSVLQRCSDCVCELVVQDEGILRDIDRP